MTDSDIALAAPRFASERRYQLGPGLITGAADDDPSGIATYLQAGAAWGYGSLWTVVATLPFMISIQMVCAHVGRVTGRGLSANMKGHLHGAVVYPLVVLLLIANVLNLAADISAMGTSVAMIFGGPAWLYAAILAAISLLLEVFVPLPQYAPALRIMTISLLAYVATTLLVHVPWLELPRLMWPAGPWDREHFIIVVAVFGTTISPYMFFWQASEEAEEEEIAAFEHRLFDRPDEATVAFARIRFDTIVGMIYSNAIAFFIILTGAAVLNQHGLSDIQTSAQAIASLEPLAGRYAATVFALGIIGTGLLALPVLAGSAAYALAEAAGGTASLASKPKEARFFYTILAVAILGGTLLSLSPVAPMKLLFWSAVVNGVIAVPLMATIMFLASRTSVMGAFMVKGWLKGLGWTATALMAAVVVGMFL